ncbi:hypothetical protein ACFFLM_03365 [Deinococcus oregonensis]|uniref:Uncharacterized protein n=1 Tax=Deinococcus oregonensis TaxID=1805970 RepID=A0ABV6AU38_9DEIO
MPFSIRAGGIQHPLANRHGQARVLGSRNAHVGRTTGPPAVGEPAQQGCPAHDLARGGVASSGGPLSSRSAHRRPGTARQAENVLCVTAHAALQIGEALAWPHLDEDVGLFQLLWIRKLER